MRTCDGIQEAARLAWVEPPMRLGNPHAHPAIARLSEAGGIRAQALAAGRGHPRVAGVVPDGSLMRTRVRETSLWRGRKT